MSSKNDCFGLQKPVSCFDCQCKILSDPVLDVLEEVDWSRFRFLERYKGRGRPCRYSRVGLLKALCYMELASVPSVHELIRVLNRDKYKLNILGLEGLPSDSVFSRFKTKLGDHMDRIISLLTGMIRSLHPGYMRTLGVDSTKIEGYSRNDKQSGWGYDNIQKRAYKGYKAHILYDLECLSPVSYTLTSARMHDSTQFKPLIKKLGASILCTVGVYADRAYDSKARIEGMARAGITLINPLNKRKSKKKRPKYRLQDYCQTTQKQLDEIYKNRNDCEVTNNLLKERLNITNTRTTGRQRTRTKIGLTIIARQIQVHYQLKHKQNPRTTIIKQI